MAVIVEVCGAFGLNVKEEDGDHANADTARAGNINAVGQHYCQTASFIYLEGAVTETPNLSVEIDRRIRAGWMSFNRYRRELYDRPNAFLLDLKVRMVKVDVVQALLYGCGTWTPLKVHYRKLLRTRVLLRILGAWCRAQNHRFLSYAEALQQTGCESIETTVCTRRLRWVGSLIRMDGGRLPNRVMFGGMEGSRKRGSG